MHDTAYYVRSVAEFHAKHDAPIGCAVNSAKEWGRDVTILRKSLIYEEAGEIMLALHDRDEVELVDGLGDLLYVAAGLWVAVIGVKSELPNPIYLPALKSPELWTVNFEQMLMRRVDAVVLSAMQVPQIASYPNAIYSAVYALHELGYDPKAVFDEIHSSNMTKTPTKGDIRVRVKGPDYRAPDVRRFLRGR